MTFELQYTDTKSNARAGLIFYPGGKVERTVYAPLLHELAEDGTKKTRHPQRAEAGQGSQSSRDSSKMATQRFIEASNSSSLLFWNKIRLSLCCGSARFSGMAKLHRRRYSSQ